MELRSVVELSPFSWRWPELVEPFDRGWDAVAVIGGREYDVRHGIGHRPCFGRDRVHTVTWLDGEPMVEAAEAEDYLVTRAVVSVIKRAGKDVKATSPAPEGYESLNVVVHRQEVVGPFARNALAVKAAEDDLAAWTWHAYLRRRLKVRTVPSTKAGATRPNPPSVVSVDPSAQAIADALLAYGDEVAERATVGAPTLVSDPEANDLVCTDAFAFLVAVICDQAVIAERAWMTPLLLKRALGELTPAGVLGSPELVRATIAGPPALHRYVNNVPRWLIAAAARVLNDYDGDARSIWGDEPTAAELQTRLTAFVGIGQKKAAMAVEILARDLGVPIKSLEGSDVAYDIHVRRVFLRAGLAARDTPEAVIAAGRMLHPTRPGALDFPTWLVGRQWCHPTQPNCAACPIGNLCPRHIDRAAAVRG